MGDVMVTLVEDLEVMEDGMGERAEEAIQNLTAIPDSGPSPSPSSPASQCRREGNSEFFEVKGGLRKATARLCWKNGPLLSVSRSGGGVTSRYATLTSMALGLAFSDFGR